MWELQAFSILFDTSQLVALWPMTESNEPLWRIPDEISTDSIPLNLMWHLAAKSQNFLSGGKGAFANSIDAR